MKYYATQIGKDPEGAPTILQQIEVGAPLANYWEMRNVCDTNGNTYYSYGSKVGKITSDGVETTFTTVDMGLNSEEIQGLALNRDQDYLYFATNDATFTGTTLKLYKVPVANFVYAFVELVKDMTGSIGTNCDKIMVDKFENVWFMKSYNITISRILNVYNTSSSVLYNIAANGNNTPPADYNTSCFTIDKRGYMWITHGTNNGLYKVIYDQVNNLTGSLKLNNPVTSPTIDLCVDIDDNLWGLTNKQDGIKQNTIVKYSGLTNVGEVTFVSIPLTKEDLTTPLYYCYNLHTNGDGDIFFSSYHPTDGYNIYKIAHGTTTITKYFSGLGSKTTGNDPYGYFLSQYGHTGANI